MTTYICKCGQRVQKSSSADNTGNRLKGYGPGHECYGCPYAMPWGGNEWNETAKRFVQDIKGYECRMSRTLSYGSLFIGSTKDTCICSVFSLDFDFLEQISAWVKDTFSQGELTGGFSRDKIRPTDYSHNGRYCCTFVCAANKKGISAKAALLSRFFNPNGSRKDMTPQQEMEKILADIKKEKEVFACAPAQKTDAAVTTAENAAQNAAAATPTTSESAADAKTSEAWTSGATDAASSSGQHSLVGTAPATQSLSDAAAACLEAEPAERPGFDYSGMSARTVDTLHVAERMIREARRDYVIAVAQAVSIAHEELCGGVVQNLHNSKHGNRGEAAFCAWCASVGVGRRTAYNLLQVDALMQGATPEEQAVLEQASPSLLYAAAKPSAPAELVQGVKEGSITTHKQYQELLKENQQLRTDRVEAMNQADRERARADRAEAERDKARADQLSTAKDCNRLGLKASQEKARADKAEARAKDAENQLSGSRQVAEAAKLRADKLQEENAALKKQPIAAVVDEEEVERRAKALAHQWDKEELDRLATEKAWGLADARNSELAKDNTALRKQLATLQARANDNTQADFETANYCASLFRSAWDTCKGSYSRLTGEDLESTFQTLCGALNSIMEEASLLCRQPADYDGGAADEPDV